MGTLTAEVFAVGKWNGYDFEAEDIASIAANFKKFRDLLKVPVKLGHNSEQPMTDGKPALGWVDDVWVEGTKLIAKLVDVPAVVMEAIRKKLYRKVSIELDLDVTYKGEHHPFVLTAVALLGADIPAVSVLADLDAFLASRRAAFSAKGRACFEAVAGELTEGVTNMDLKELSEKVVALSGQVATLTASVATLTAENATLKQQNASFEAERANRAAAEKTAAAARNRADATRLFEEGVKAGKITPAQREVYSRTLRLDNDDAAAALAIKDVEQLVGISVASFSANGNQQASGAGAGTNDEPDTRAPDIIVAERAAQFMAKTGEKSISAATQHVLRADADLGKRYLQQNMGA